MEQNIAFALSLVTMGASLAAYTRARARLTATQATLDALRANCFVTSKLGHRVRYVNASTDERAKAEATRLAA